MTKSIQQADLQELQKHSAEAAGLLKQLGNPESPDDSLLSDQWRALGNRAQ